ncbi:hypothetical protein P4C99_17665 [Pontiellaceae bacterium B1224]|nr:hypothetical protein [Pontiellaceae bacterium B1224]
MKKAKKGKGVVKGAPSGFVISLMVHAAAFVLAGALVVFNVVNKEEKKFVPPKPVERPKMKLKKPKVKVKKDSKPRSSERIVTKVQRANMPEIFLPEMSGIGDGIGTGGGGGGFEIMTDLAGLSTMFGERFTTGSDLKGHFYNFNRSRSGSKIPMSPDQLKDVVHKFMASGWRKSMLAKYYRSPQALYSPAVCITTTLSEMAPDAFGEGLQEGYCWAVLYEGELVYPEDITFRFWAVGDKFLGAAVDDETVLFTAYKAADKTLFGDIWRSKDPKDNVYYFAESRATPSDWITLKANEPRDLKIILGDLEGGLVYHIVCVEVKGETYPLTRAGTGPTWPIFRTGEIPRDTLDVMYSNLYFGDANLTNGPIFRDYVAKSSAPETVAEPVEETPPAEVNKQTEPQMRVWTSLTGKTLEAVFKTVIGKDAVVETANKKQIKLPLEQLSPEDQEYIALARPPVFDINFTKTSNQVPTPPISPFLGGVQRPLQMFDYQFGARLKQTTTGDYDHELTVEFFAIGEEIVGDKMILLDRQTSTFIPSEQEKRVFEFLGKPDVHLRRIAYRDSAPVRGIRYSGFLVTITDKRGEIIAYRASSNYLYENLENLRQLQPNNYFDRECKRAFPTQPSEDNRGSGAIEGKYD